MLLSMPAFKLQFGGCAVGSGLNTMDCAPQYLCCGGRRRVGGDPLAGPTRCLLACSLRQEEKASSWMELHAAVDDAFHSPRVAGPQFCCW
eukprot:symbB.v1.2.016060.t1/scaffold1176.1/size133768/3